MTMFPCARNESRRLEELRRYQILDTAPESEFERIVGLAERFFVMPMVAITFVDESRVWLKASRGIPIKETPRETSLCAVTILKKEVLVVRDIRTDERFCNRFEEVVPPGIRFYAGAALRGRAGHALGALCVLDTMPREFTQEDEMTLADMAALVVSELRLRRLTTRLRTAVKGGQRTQRALARQHELLQRLVETRERAVTERTAELERENEALRAEVECIKLVSAGMGLARDRARAADQAKSEFLARMTHELRTPLNAILGFGQILQSAIGERERVECTTQVITAGRHMLSLINEVLDLSRIEEGRTQLALEPVRVAEIVDESIDLVRPLAARKRVDIDISRHAEPALIAHADRRRLKQVLLNLLSNAMKYGPEDGRVTIGWRKIGARAVRLTVTDRGPGIERDQAALLFTPFERLGAEFTEVPGTGLGLALTKRLVELMGGKVGVRTAPGRGSTFWAQFPLEPSADTDDPVAFLPDDAGLVSATIPGEAVKRAFPLPALRQLRH